MLLSSLLTNFKAISKIFNISSTIDIPEEFLQNEIGEIFSEYLFSDLKLKKSILSDINEYFEWYGKNIIPLDKSKYAGKSLLNISMETNVSIENINKLKLEFDFFKAQVEKNKDVKNVRKIL